MLKRFLEWLAPKLEERRISINGELYLQRYYLWGRMPPELAKLWNCGNVPKERFGWLPTTYLHRFHLPDPDREVHNHPWIGRGRILVGGYKEVRLVSKPLEGEDYEYRVKAYLPGDKQEVLPDTFHRVSELFADEVWTVFSVGERQQKWGYMVPGKGFIPYDKKHADPNSDPGDGDKYATTP